jgi:hypothetical protein
VGLHSHYWMIYESLASLMRVAAVGGTNNDVAQKETRAGSAYNNLKTKKMLGRRHNPLRVSLLCGDNLLMLRRDPLPHRRCRRLDQPWRVPPH